ncbi:MAG: bifunctional glycosyltransferase family 2 protein/CDP-glycerol:glycerophosphate glycerophosphotransferase [Candidatus Ancillula sp.]|jgi:glycosyltransferase involved in cell wall biosynthesis/CDP-glycerol glycerophosphotransferase (TagB/SpsB family)|nr:bifunctional glycosyltransferase family 2 protein/CDP-glycerol:glycerophosphate glycerophosphotransferase [Candidatus Ancillula sp.]
MIKNPKFSIVIPVYNVGAYLAECIDSVLAQDIEGGFENNVELILVNDGSTDNSKEVCQKYLKKYPNNVLYFEKPNSGVSDTRNLGLENSHGEFVWFIDGDDKISDNCLRLAEKMFREDEELPALGVRVKFFEAKENFHPKDYIFAESKIIDLQEKSNFVQTAGATVLFRRSAIGNIRYENTLKFFEDGLFLFNVLMSNKLKFGTIRDALYMYRRRLSGTSAMNSVGNGDKQRRDFIAAMNRIFDQSVKVSQDKKVLPFIQQVFLYFLSFKSQKVTGFLEATYPEYEGDVLDLLERCSYSEIRKSRRFSITDRQNLLDIKYTAQTKEGRQNKIADSSWRRKCIITKFSNCKIDDEIVFQLKKFRIYFFSACQLKNGDLELIASFPNFDFESYPFEVKFKYGKQEIRPEVFSVNNFDRFEFFDWNTHQGKALKIIIPKGQYKKLTCELHFNNHLGKHYSLLADLSHFTSYFRLPTTTPNVFRGLKYEYFDDSWSKVGNWIIESCPNDKGLKFSKYRYNKTKVLENKFFDKILEFVDFNKDVYSKEEIETARKIRKNYLFKLAVNKYLQTKFNYQPKRIWLINDRFNRATDNGYYLYKYLQKVAKKNNIKPYFVLEKDCDDWNRLKEEGFNLVKLGSKKHIKLLLEAEIIASSHANAINTQPFGRLGQLYLGLYSAKFIHLWHGVTHMDHSQWLNKFNKNFYLWTVCSPIERKWILDGGYNYQPGEIVATGFPRYDPLDQDVKDKVITIMLTWRNDLAFADKFGNPMYSGSFKESDYYKFLNGLIHNEKLLEAINKYNYKLQLALHPNHSEQAVDFRSDNDRVKILGVYPDIVDMLNKTQIFVSDTSGVIFDAAYAKKSVIYTHFDYDKLMSTHIYKGTKLNFETDNFGPVCKDLDSTVDTLIEAMKNGGQMDKKYLERRNKFFAGISNSTLSNPTPEAQNVFEAIQKVI